MQIRQQNAAESNCPRQALVESMARGNPVAAEELRLLLRMESQALPRRHRLEDR